MKSLYPLQAMLKKRKEMHPQRPINIVCGGLGVANMCLANRLMECLGGASRRRSDWNAYSIAYKKSFAKMFLVLDP